MSDYSPDLNPAQIQNLLMSLQAGQPASAPTMAQDSEEVQRLREELARVSPELLDVPKTPTGGQRVLAMLSDALNAYASGINPNIARVPSPLARIFEEIRARNEENRIRTIRAENETRRRMAEYRLRDIENRQARGEALSEAEAKAQAEAYRQADKEARGLGIVAPEGASLRYLNTEIAKANQARLQGTAAAIERKDTESFLNTLAEKGVPINQHLVARIRSGDPNARDEARSIASAHIAAEHAASHREKTNAPDSKDRATYADVLMDLTALVHGSKDNPPLVTLLHTGAATPEGIRAAFEANVQRVHPSYAESLKHAFDRSVEPTLQAFEHERSRNPGSRPSLEGSSVPELPPIPGSTPSPDYFTDQTTTGSGQ